MILAARPARWTLRWTALVAGLLALLAVLARPSTADAHGVLRGSDPRSGAHLTVAPRLLRLTFNEAIELAVARLELRGPDDHGVALSALRRGDSAAVLVADVTGALRAGTYTVAWQIAGRDGHPVRGTFRFTVAPDATGLASAPVDPMAAADSARATAGRRFRPAPRARCARRRAPPPR